MHPAPHVDSRVLKAFRLRLSWGVLGLEQPSGDLPLALHHFAHRWSHPRQLPELSDWQLELLHSWRRNPSLPLAPEPVLQQMVECLRMEDESSLELWFPQMLFELARGRLRPEDIKPRLRYSWERLSQGVQRLRQGLPVTGGEAALGLGGYSSEAESVLRRALSAMQQLQHYFSSPTAEHLEEAGWRWSAMLEEWDQVAHLCLTGLQPAYSSMHWGNLLEWVPLEGDTRQQARDDLLTWFQDWSLDFAYTLAPYQSLILGLEPALERLGLALLRWQKLLPGWPEEVAQEWSLLQQSLPPVAETPVAPSVFRWLDPQSDIDPSFVSRNPWRAWLKQARQIPPRGPIAKDAQRLHDRLRMTRLLTTLTQDTFQRLQQPFPEQAWVNEAPDWLSGWLEGYEPLSEPVAAHIERRIGELEQQLLREFHPADRSLPAQKA